MTFDSDYFFVQENRRNVLDINKSTRGLSRVIRLSPLLRGAKTGAALWSAFDKSSRYTHNLLSLTKKFTDAAPAQAHGALAFLDAYSGEPEALFLAAQEARTMIPATHVGTMDKLDYLLQSPWCPPNYMPGAEQRPATVAEFLRTFADVTERMYKHL